MSPTDGPEQRQQQLPISNEQAFCIIPSIQAGSEGLCMWRPIEHTHSKATKLLVVHHKACDDDDYDPVA